MVYFNAWIGAPLAGWVMFLLTGFVVATVIVIVMVPLVDGFIDDLVKGIKKAIKRTILLAYRGVTGKVILFYCQIKKRIDVDLLHNNVRDEISEFRDKVVE